MDIQTYANWATTLTGPLTLAAVIFAALQLYFSRSSAQTAFEDQLFREYREIVKEPLDAEVPIAQLLSSVGSQHTNPDNEKILGILYRYFDLSNQQVQLSYKGKISRQTWEDWREGIRFNLKLRFSALRTLK